jgi:hypothetical protein
MGYTKKHCYYNYTCVGVVVVVLVLVLVVYYQLNLSINLLFLADYTGGVCCEPHGIFIICNNFQHNAFVLYDQIHNTTFSKLNEKWRNFLIQEGRLPEIFSNGDRYLRIVQANYPPIPRFVCVSQA